MNKNLTLAIVVVAASLTACGSKTDANEKNFGAAMTQYFNKKGDLCLNTTRWPVDLSEMDLNLQKTMQTGTVNQMAALEAAGLVKGEDTEVDIMGLMGDKSNGPNAKIRRYTLTDAAQPFTQENEVSAFGLNGRTTVKETDLCWGKMALDKIVKWEEVMKFGKFGVYQEAVITYTYKIDGTADWAKTPEVQAAFSFVKSTLDGAGSHNNKHIVKLTNQGWEAKGLD